MQCLQLLHISFFSWPFNAQAFLAVRLWNLELININGIHLFSEFYHMKVDLENFCQYET